MIILVPVCLQFYLDLCDPIQSLGDKMLEPIINLFSLCFLKFNVELGLGALRRFPLCTIGSF